MNHLLDNPAWNALLSGNKNFSKGNEQIKYFDSEVSPFVGFDNYSPDKSDILYHLISGQRTLAIISPKEIIISNKWHVMEHMKVLQMVHKYSALSETTSANCIQLEKQHVPEMIALTGMTHPGPFLERTIEFGNYYGIFNKNKLVAMAGQRLHVNEYMEISAVCTHPDYLGKGYASELITDQINKIKAASNIPFLHVKEDNNRAVTLYKKLGFEARKQLDIYIMEKRTE
jgi:predicted GNAT family acetyltransferase